MNRRKLLAGGAAACRSPWPVSSTVEGAPVVEYPIETSCRGLTKPFCGRLAGVARSTGWSQPTPALLKSIRGESFGPA